MTKTIAEYLRTKHPSMQQSGASGDDDFMGHIAYVKVFGPGRYTYFIVQWDEPYGTGEVVVFGYCVSPLGWDCDEWGYQSVREWDEMNAGSAVKPFTVAKETDGVLARIRLNPYVEIDKHFKPVPMRDALAQLAGIGLADCERYRAVSA